jgi:hypothetical protein
MIPDILPEAVSSTMSTMATVFLMLFLTGIIAEKGLFHKIKWHIDGGYILC